MKKILAFLAVLIWAPGVLAAPAVTKLPELSQKGYAVESVSGETGVFNIGPTYPLNLIGFELGSSFVGTIYACESKQTVSIDADVCDSAAALSADIATPINFTTTRLWFVLEITTGEGAGTTSRLTIRGTSEQIAGASPDQVDVLIGGVDGIPAVDNPNDAPQICAQADNACFYKSPGSGWWMALSGDQVSTTTWASANVEPLIDSFHEVNNSGAIIGANRCFQPREQNGIDSGVACAASFSQSQMVTMKDTTLVAWEYAIAVDLLDDSGCQFGITIDGGATLVGGTAMDVPSVQGGSTAAGVVTIFPIGVELAAGTPFQGMIGDSANCEDGAACNGCTGGLNLNGGLLRLMVMEHS